MLIPDPQFPSAVCNNAWGGTFLFNLAYSDLKCPHSHLLPPISLFYFFGQRYQILEIRIKSLCDWFLFVAAVTHYSSIFKHLSSLVLSSQTPVSITKSNKKENKIHWSRNVIWISDNENQRQIKWENAFPVPVCDPFVFYLTKLEGCGSITWSVVDKNMVNILAKARKQAKSDMGSPAPF